MRHLGTQRSRPFRVQCRRTRFCTRPAAVVMHTACGLHERQRRLAAAATVLAVAVLLCAIAVPAQAQSPSSAPGVLSVVGDLTNGLVGSPGDSSGDDSTLAGPAGLLVSAAMLAADPPSGGAGGPAVISPSPDQRGMAGNDDSSEDGGLPLLLRLSAAEPRCQTYLM